VERQGVDARRGQSRREIIPGFAIAIGLVQQQHARTWPRGRKVAGSEGRAVGRLQGDHAAGRGDTSAIALRGGHRRRDHSRDAQDDLQVLHIVVTPRAVVRDTRTRMAALRLWLTFDPRLGHPRVGCQPDATDCRAHRTSGKAQRVRTSIRVRLALCLVLSVAGRPAAQPPPGTTLVKARRLVDPRSGRVLSPAAVLVENGRIREVGAPADVQQRTPADALVIDLGDATLLPGLIDGHTHLLLDVVVPPEAEMNRRANGTFATGLLLAMAESPAKR